MNRAKTVKLIKKISDRCLTSLLIIAMVVGFLPSPVHATTQQIRQEINITDGEALTSTGTLESSARVQLDTTKYSATATYYFEAVIAGAASNTGTIKLARAGTTTYDASLVGATSASYTLVRSAAFTPPASTQTEYTVKLVGDGTHSQTIKSARIIVIQSSNPLTSTETQIEIGNTETGKSNTTAAALNAPKYWKYNASNWDAGQTFYAEATYKTNASSTSETFTAAGSASWTAPAGVTSVTAETWGGGGGSGGGTSTSLPGGSGGGGGAYASKVITVTPGNSYTRVVGAAGAVSGGTAGGASTFTGDSAVQSKACGGNSGADNGGTAGAGGTTTCSDGTTKFAGGNGAAGASTSGGGGGESASSASTGNNAIGTAGGTGTAGTDGSAGQALGGQGVAGNNPGAGAGGSGRRSGGSEVGATGGVGQVKLTYNLPYAVTVTLQESDGTGDGFVGWTNKATIVSSSTATTATRVRSSAFTPVDGRNYRIVSSVASGGNYDVYNAKIVVDQSLGFNALGQTSRTWSSVSIDSSNHNVYATVSTGGDIYEQTAGTGSFVALGQSALNWYGVSVDSSNHNVYAVVSGGDIYEQTAGTGGFTALAQTARSWDGISVDPSNHNVYATVYGGDIYEQTAGTGSFVALGQTVRNWEGVSVDSSNHNVYAVAYGGDIYEQTAGTGSFVALGQSALNWYGVSVDSSNHNVYAVVSGGDIYEQTAGTGGFTALAQTARSWDGISVDPSNHNVYATISSGDIYKQLGGIASITKLEPQYLLANTSLAAGTSLQNFLTKWDSTEWSGVTNTYTHIVDAANNSTSVVETDTSGGTQVTGSVVTSPDNQGPLKLFFDLSNMSYSSKSFSANSQALDAADVKFNSDGTKMFVADINSSTIYQYALSTAYDVSTASYASKSFLLSGQDTAPEGFSFNSDGTKMFVVFYTTKSVYQYSLSTPYDVSAASYASKSFSTSVQVANPRGLAFSPDGTKMFVVDNTSHTIYQYALSTAYDVSTASYASKSFSVGTQTVNPIGIVFNSDGTTMFVSDVNGHTIYQYALSTAYDVSTASYASKSLSVGTQTSFPGGLAFNSNGTSIFVIDSGNNNTIFQYATPSFFMTMPSNGNLDVKATTNNADIYADRIVVAVGPAATTSYTQSSYRFFNNTDSTDVGSALATQNVSATLPWSNAQFRLRMLVDVGGADLASSGQSFKLQFAQQSGLCDTAFSGETYADVTNTTAISFNNNFTPENGVALTANANDPTDGTISNQNYVESNNFTNSQSSIPASSDGKWDFSLYDKGASDTVTYCFRIVKSDGSLLDTYSQIPQITTAAYQSRGGGGGVAGGEISATPDTTTTGGTTGGGSTAGGETSATPNTTTTGGGAGGGGGDTGFLFGSSRASLLASAGGLNIDVFKILKNLLKIFLG